MDFLTYHIESAKIRDIDPANDCLLYISDRFELSMEQRYWIAFLYSCSYCAPTTFYIYNEFPDFENVNVARLQRWWAANKGRTVFQTDRLKIRTMNKFVETYESYRAWVGNGTQQARFDKMQMGEPWANYEYAQGQVQCIRNIGRFTTFIYLEMLHVLTNFKNEPVSIDWRNASNCRIGLCYAIGWPPDVMDYRQLDAALWDFKEAVAQAGCPLYSVFNIETTLCAYKKYRHGKRYVGYYLDRQLKEINKMAANVTAGVAWRVLYEFREETYKHLTHEDDTLNWWLRHGQDLGGAGINTVL